VDKSGITLSQATILHQTLTQLVSSKTKNSTIRSEYTRFLYVVWNSVPNMGNFKNASKYVTSDFKNYTAVLSYVAEQIADFLYCGLHKKGLLTFRYADMQFDLPSIEGKLFFLWHS
jgi:hypothetical protein